MQKDIVKILPESLCNQIAAGEVIQRPSSIVKELVENSIDSNATSINIFIEEGGRNKIIVMDNGCGMSSRDLRLAIERHATSKISDFEDLYNIHTKGFRGEALPSIVSVAQVDIKTRRISDELGTLLSVEGGKVLSQKHCTLDEGTTVIVKNLFFNIPVRRNYLKSNTVENKHIIEEIYRVSLIHFNISFSLKIDGKNVLQVRRANFKQRIVSIFRLYKEKLLFVEGEVNFFRVSGYIVSPESVKKKKSEQYLFVNNRYFRSRYFHHAVLKAYEGLIVDGNTPVYFLSFEIDPKMIDVNIHPTKTEIKFQEEHMIYKLLLSILRASLGKANFVPPIDFTVENISNPNNKVLKNPEIELDKHYNPFNDIRRKKKTLDDWADLYEIAKKQDTVNSELHIPKEDLLIKEESTSITFFKILLRYTCFTIENQSFLLDKYRAYYSYLFYSVMQEENLSDNHAKSLLIPEIIYFSEKELIMIDKVKQDLMRFGFSLEISKSKVTLDALPNFMKEKEIKPFLNDILDDFGDMKYSKEKLYILTKQRLSSNLARARYVHINSDELETIVRYVIENNVQKSPDNKSVFMSLDDNFFHKVFK